MPDPGARSDAAVEACRYLMPPEFFRATPDHIVPSSPTKSNVVRGQGSIDREAVNVWGIGTLVFELSTGRVAGTWAHPPSLQGIFAHVPCAS